MCVLSSSQEQKTWFSFCRHLYVPTSLASDLMTFWDKWTAEILAEKWTGLRRGDNFCFRKSTNQNNSTENFCQQSQALFLKPCIWLVVSRFFSVGILEKILFPIYLVEMPTIFLSHPYCPFLNFSIPDLRAFMSKLIRLNFFWTSLYMLNFKLSKL